MLQKTPKPTVEIPVHLMETVSLVQCGQKPESWSNRALGIHALWAALIKYLEFVLICLVFKLSWLFCIDCPLGKESPWGKEAPGKYCHGRFLCSSTAKLKWSPSSWKCCASRKKFHYLNLTSSSMFCCVGLYPLPWRDVAMGGMPTAVLT